MALEKANNVTLQRSVPLTIPLPQQIIKLSRPFNNISPLLASFVGFILAGGSLFKTDFSLLWLAVSMILIHSGITLANDVADIEVDKANHVSTPLTHGSRRVVRVFGAFAFMVMAAGWAIAFFFTPTISFIAVTAMLVLGLLYNHPPFRLSMRPVGSIVVMALCYGFLPIAAGYGLLSGTPSFIFWTFAVLYTAARVALSLFKDFKDTDGDKAQGKLTFLLYFGEETTKRISNVLAIIGLVGLIILVTILVARVSAFGAIMAALLLSSVATVIIAVRYAPMVLSPNDMLFRFDRLMILQTFFDIGMVLCLIWL